MQSTNHLLASMEGTVGALNQIIASPEVKRAVHSLDTSLANVDRLTHEASIQAAPLLSGLRTVSHSADQTLKQASATLATAGSAFGADEGGDDLAGTLTELKDAARSLQDLTDYLERHPGSLVRGKSAGVGQ